MAEKLNHQLVARALSLEGTCTGEHGVGLHKMDFLVTETGAGAVDMMRTIKRALDPKNIMNPGKIFLALNVDVRIEESPACPGFSFAAWRAQRPNRPFSTPAGLGSGSIDSAPPCAGASRPAAAAIGLCRRRALLARASWPREPRPPCSLRPASPWCAT